MHTPTLETDPEFLISNDYWRDPAVNIPPFRRLLSMPREAKRMAADQPIAEHIGSLAVAGEVGDAVQLYFPGDRLPEPVPNTGRVLKAVIDVRKTIMPYTGHWRQLNGMRDMMEAVMSEQDFEANCNEVAHPDLMPVRNAFHVTEGPRRSFILFRRTARYMLADPRYRYFAGVDADLIVARQEQAIPTHKANVGDTMVDIDGSDAKIISASLIEPSGSVIRRMPMDDNEGDSETRRFVRPVLVPRAARPSF